MPPCSRRTRGAGWRLAAGLLSKGFAPCKPRACARAHTHTHTASPEKPQPLAPQPPWLPAPALTQEHYFTQTWCRGKRVWEAESACLDCLQFSHRAYRDPDFKTPEQHDKEHWTALVAEQAALGEA